MKRKLVLISAALFLALTLSVGMYAYTYSTATATIGVNVAAEEIATYEPAPPIDQPDWNLMLPWGDANQEILTVVGAGDQTTIPSQYPNAGAHYDKVDDPVSSPDDWSTYVYSTTKLFRTDLYSIADHVEGDADITGVTLVFRIAADATGTAYGSAAIKTNGQVYKGPQQITTGATFTNKSHTWTLNPATNAAWTWSEIDALQAGAEIAKEPNSTYAALTQVYVIVDYQNIIIEGEVPSGDIFTITPDVDYPGDLHVNVYLTNTGNLLKALQYLNIKLYMADSLEAAKTPSYQVLSLENGVAGFNMEGGTASSYTIEVAGGSYRLISDDPDDWGAGWSVTPEFYIEISQK